VPEDTLIAAIDVFFTSDSSMDSSTNFKHPNNNGDVIVVVPMLSVEQCCMLTREMVLPHLLALDGTTTATATTTMTTRQPSKGLAVALQHISRSCPVALIDACFIPLLQSTDLSVSRYQAELIRETVKHWGGSNTPPSATTGGTATISNMVIPQHHHFQLVSALCATASSSSAKYHYWNEHSVDIMTDLIQTRCYSKYITVQVLEVILGGISRQATGEEMQKSVKFAKLMLSVVKEWPEELRGMSPVKIQQLRMAAQRNGTFMSKSIVTALDTL